MKSKCAPKAFLIAVALFALAGFVAAQNIPVRNWDVPRGDLGKLAVVPPTVFSPVSPPCRLDDSRLSSGGSGPIPGSGTRAYDFIPGGSVSCGSLPPNVVALSLFFTVVGPSGPGFIFAFPTGSPPGSPTSVVNYAAGELKNAAAIVPVEAGTGSFTVGVGGAGTDLIIDLNGVFYNTLVNDQQLAVSTNNGGGAAIFAHNSSAVNSSRAIEAYENGAGLVYGVFGQISAAAQAGSVAVRGTSQGIGIGVSGSSISGWGVEGNSDSNVGIVGGSNGSYGVFGTTNNTASGGTGVMGLAGLPVAGVNLVPDAGVKGAGHTGRGVIGLVDDLTGRGVSGYIVGTNGAQVTAGHLGVSATTGVLSNGDIMATGPKFFVEPHPTDASQMIRFVSLEGNEAGTYFRGKAKFERGLARIPVPEDFRMVTDPEGLSIQVTPIGDMASVAVVRIDLDEILVKASRNVEFFYTVNGVRKAYKDVRTVVVNDFVFVPERPDEGIPLWLSEDARSRLIRNGTYNADGTVNLETAHRLGWDKTWAKKTLK
jgi:hypothetical protein